MANTNQPRGQAENVENQKRGWDLEALKTRSIKFFVESKLLGKNSEKFYNACLSAKKFSAISPKIVEEYEKYISKEPFADLLTHEEMRKLLKTETIKNIIRNVALKEGVCFENNRAALRKIIEAEFALTPTQKKAVEEEIREIKFTALKDYSRNGGMRRTFMESLFPENTPVKRNFLDFLDSIDMGWELTQNQKQAMQELHGKGFPLWYEEIESFLALFPSFEQKQNLIKAFMPTVSLEVLEKNQILLPSKIRQYIKENLLNDTIYPSIDREMREKLAQDKAFIDSIPKDQILVPTIVFPESVVDTLLNASNFNKLVQDELNTAYQEYKIHVPNLPRDIKIDSEGRQATDFIELLKNEISHIAHIEDLDDREHLSGNKPLVLELETKFEDSEKNSSVEKIYVTIEKWDEFDGRSPLITVRYHSLGNRVHDMEVGTSEKLTYREFYAMLDKTQSGRVLQKSTVTSMIETREIKEITTNPENIHSLARLNNMLDLVDVSGSKYPLQVGLWFVGKIGQNVQAFTITAIDERSGTITVWNGESMQPPFTYAEFYAGFTDLEGASRIGELNSMQTTLDRIQDHGERKSKFADLEYDAEKKRFVQKDRKNENGYEGIRFFPGKDKSLIEVKSMENGMVDLIVHNGVEEIEVKENEKVVGKKYKSATGARKQVGAAMFYTLLEKHQCTPGYEAAPFLGVETKDPHIHMHGWLLGGYMKHLSFHDIMSGFKKVTDFIKHEMEHSSKGHTSKAALKIAGLMGMETWNSHWYDEMMADEQTEETKLMDEAVERLGKMNPPKKRQEHILHVVKNPKAPDYQVTGAMMSMLKKHGTLYAGELAKLEWSWFFFKRIVGIDVNSDINANPIFRYICEDLKKNGRQIREEVVIYTYLQQINRWHQAAYGRDGPSINPNLWRKVRGAWEDGQTEEMKNAATDIKRTMTLDPKLDFVVKKFKDKEYAAGLGGFESVWGSAGGSPKETLMPAFLFAMSNIPTHLDESTLMSVTLEKMGWRTQYPLLFAGNPKKQKLLRSVVKTLVNESWNQEMVNSYGSFETIFKKDPDSSEAITRLAEFWKSHGDYIAKKLAVTPEEPEIYVKQDRPGYDHYKEYYEGISGAIWDSGWKWKPDEYENGVYKTENMSYALVNTEKYARDIQTNGGPGLLMGDAPNLARFDEYLKAIDQIKTLSITDEDKLQMYERYSKTILKRIIEAWVNSGVWQDFYSGKMPLPDYLNKLKRRGIGLTPRMDTYYLESAEYKESVRMGFQKFMHGGSARTEVEATETNTIKTFANIMSEKSILTETEKAHIRTRFNSDKTSPSRDNRT